MNDIIIPKICDPSLKLPDPDLMQYYQDLESRVIWLLGEIDENCYQYMSQIIKFNKDDDGIPVEDRIPIRIIVDNYGGSLEVARSLCAIMDLSKTPIYTLGIGTIASAASLVYACGHKRFATKNSVFLLHNGSCKTEGTFDQLMAMFEDYKRQIDEMHQIYAEHTSYEEEELNDRLSQDWYIPVEEAKEHGLVDEIIDSIDIFYK